MRLGERVYVSIGRWTMSRGAAPRLSEALGVLAYPGARWGQAITEGDSYEH
jgi:hypothetical protein